MTAANCFRVVPLYGQVQVCDAAPDAADVDRPQWESGDEPVLASAQCIVLATRSDLDGPVEIEVQVGASEDRPAGHLLFEGELLTTGEGAAVGNPLADELHRVPLPIGWHPVRIYGDQPRDPARFLVVFDGTSAPA
jgi:hypothetical protein